MLLQLEEEKVIVLFANFFGVSPFKIDVSQDIIMQFGADTVDIKELSWIISEEFNMPITETDVLSINCVIAALNRSYND